MKPYSERKNMGRPKNFKMSEASKKAISESKKGYKHTQETKDKISRGVKRLHETGAPIDIIMKTDLSLYSKYKDTSGYININIPNPEVGKPSFQQRYHVALVEKALGRKLRGREEIHHWGDKDNNDLKLLALCKNKKEHVILDKAKKILDRERSLDEK